MRKIWLSLLLILSLVIPLAGCSASNIIVPIPTEINLPTVTSIPTPVLQTTTPTVVKPTAAIQPTVVQPVVTKPIMTTEPVSNEPYVVDLNKVKLGNWALFGSINVNNYQLGVKVDKDIRGYQPFYIVNRMNETIEAKTITTEIGEIKADIPINKLLHNGDLANIIGINSDLSTDNLVVVGYVAATNSLTIMGFTPNTTRKAVIRYKPDTVYNVTLNNEKNLSQPLAKYFKLDKTRITVKPDSFQPIDYSFEIPSNSKTLDNFKVWIYVEATYIAGKGVDYNVGYYSYINVNMN